MIENATWPKFSERCHNESTCNVIFVLQRLRYQILSWPEWDEEFEYTDGTIYQLTENRVELTEPIVWTPERLAHYYFATDVGDVPCAIESWHNEGIWLSREEAEAYVARRKYDYPDGMWRIYGLCAQGALAELLKGT